jgi:glutamyl-tRNA reductase
MGEISLAQLKQKGVQKIYLMNRTECIAAQLAAEHQAEAVSFADIKEILAQVDLAVCAASAPHYILDRVTVEKIMPSREHRPVTLLDISMPRNIDPACAGIAGVYLAHIDDLQQVVDVTMQKRQAAIGMVEAIIEEKLAAYYDRLAKTSDPSGEFHISAS